MSTSNGPPSRLFSSLMNTVNPSQRLSAEMKKKVPELSHMLIETPTKQRHE